MGTLTGKDGGLSAIRDAKKQLSLDLDENLMNKIRMIAVRDSISPNDVIRRIIGLSSKQAQRPRISVSLTDAELEKIAGDMNVNPEDTAALKKGIKEIIESEDFQ